MSKKDEREHPLLHPVRVVHPLGEHTLLNLLDQLRLLHIVCHWVGGHIKKQEVLLLCCQHTFFHLKLKSTQDPLFLKDVRVLPGSLQVSLSHSWAGTSASEGSKSHPIDIQSMSARTKVSIWSKKKQKSTWKLPELFLAGWSPWYALALHQGEHRHRGQSSSA